MTRQTDLFPEDLCESHHHGNPESRAAFDALLPHLSALQEKVLQFAKAQYDHSAPVTVHLVRTRLGMQHQTASARLTELKSMELIAPTDKRLEGCRVLEITELGQRTLREWLKRN